MTQLLCGFMPHEREFVVEIMDSFMEIELQTKTIMAGLMETCEISTDFDRYACHRFPRFTLLLYENNHPGLEKYAIWKI